MNDIEAPAAPAVSAILFDGHSAVDHTVELRLDAAGLSLIGADGADGAVRERWPIATIRRAPGSRLLRGELRLARGELGLARLVVNDAAMIDAIENACPDLDRRPKSEGRLLRRLGFWAGGAVASVLLILFVIAPRLADTIAPMIPPEREAAFGQRMADEILKNGSVLFGGDAKGACGDPAGVQALAALTAKLEAVARAHVPLTVRVMQADVANAFALPGGQIIVLDGLLKAADSPGEVAGVLAHEIGHVIARDSSRNVLRSFASGAVISYMLGDFAGGFLVQFLIEAAVNARYTREAEAAADRTALRLLSEANLPIRPLAGFFRKLGAEHGDNDGYFSTHPTNSAREQAILAAADARVGDGEPALSEAQWRALQAICR